MGWAPGQGIPEEGPNLEGPAGPQAWEPSSCPTARRSVRPQGAQRGAAGQLSVQAEGCGPCAPVPSAGNTPSPPRRRTPSSQAPMSPWQHPSFPERHRASLWWHKGPLRGGGASAPGSLWPVSLWGTRSGPSAPPPTPRLQSQLQSLVFQDTTPSTACLQKGSWGEPLGPAGLPVGAWGLPTASPPLTEDLLYLDKGRGRKQQGSPLPDGKLDSGRGGGHRAQVWSQAGPVPHPTPPSPACPEDMQPGQRVARGRLATGAQDRLGQEGALPGRGGGTLGAVWAQHGAPLACCLVPAAPIPVGLGHPGHC